MKMLLTLLVLALLRCGLSSHLQACPAPTGVQASTTNTSVTVGFTPAAGIAQYIAKVDVGGNRLARRFSTGGPVTFTGLQPATSYYVAVGSICSPGDTVYAARVPVATTSAAGTCPPVSPLSVGAVTSTQATLNFLPLSGVTSYTVHYWAVNDTSNVQTLTVTSSPAVLTGLLPGNAYVAGITVSCSATPSATTPYIIFFTPSALACGTIANVAVTAISNSTATVSFTPGTNNTSFQVIYYSAADSTRHYVNATSSPVALTGLVPGQTYYIQVLSVCQSSNLTVYSAGGYIPYSFRGTSTLTSRSALGAGVVEAYPNPAHQSVTVRLPRVPGAASAYLTLLNSLGQFVRAREVLLDAGGAQPELALAGLAPGLYTLRVAAGGQAATYRIAVE